MRHTCTNAEIVHGNWQCARFEFVEIVHGNCVHDLNLLSKRHRPRARRNGCFIKTKWQIIILIKCWFGKFIDKFFLQLIYFRFWARTRCWQIDHVCVFASSKINSIKKTKKYIHVCNVLYHAVPSSLINWNLKMFHSE